MSVLIKSLVVPGNSVTIDSSLSAILLKRLDFPTLGWPRSATVTPLFKMIPWSALLISKLIRSMTWPTREMIFPSSRPSISSSEKSRFASTRTRRSFRDSVRFSTSSENAPETVLIAAFAELTEALLMRSLIASAWARSIFSFRKARSLNSPGLATLAPRAQTASRSIFITTGPP